MRMALLITAFVMLALFGFIIGNIRGDENVSILKASGDENIGLAYPNGGVTGVGDSDEFGDPFLASDGEGEFNVQKEPQKLKIIMADKDALIWQGAGAQTL